DAGALAHALGARAGNALVMTDGVFSMDGDLAPLPELARACREHDAVLVVDDAHGIGVLGERGRGSLEHFALGQDDVPVLMGTFGKALGGFGAFVAGSTAMSGTLINRARTYIYTTALPPAVASAALAALDIVDAQPQQRAHLHALIARFREGAQALKLPLLDSFTPIQPVVIGDAARAVGAADALFERG